MGSVSQAESVISPHSLENQDINSIETTVFARMRPRGYILIPISSDTNSTMTGIPGPGRVLGSLLSSAGRRLERAIDRYRFATQRPVLTWDSIAIAWRLILALHQMHSDSNPKKLCRLYDTHRPDNPKSTADRLFWVCNGLCPHCGTPYIPNYLDDDDSAASVALQLSECLRYESSLATMDITLVFIDIVGRSHLFVSTSASQAQILDMLRVTINRLHSNSYPEITGSLEAITGLVHKMTESMASMESRQLVHQGREIHRYGPELNRQPRSFRILAVVSQLVLLEKEFDLYNTRHAAVVRMCALARELGGPNEELAKVTQDWLTDLEKSIGYAYMPAFMLECIMIARRYMTNVIHLFELQTRVEDIVVALQVPGQTVEKTRMFALRGDAARDMLDAFQLWLDVNTRHNFRRGIIQYLVELAATSSELPRTLFVQGVQIDSPYPICCGGMADVFRGVLNADPIAIKRLRTTGHDTAKLVLHKKFCRECLVWRQLSHPHILPFLGVDKETFRDHNGIAMVAPWMQRGTVMNYLLSEAYDAKSDRQRIIVEIAEGLAYLHTQQIIHGDLHGSNVFITDDGHACLADFGLSVISGFTRTQQQTPTLTVSPWRWLAPELVAMGSSIPRKTQEADVFSFGRLCLAICTTHSPFHGITDAAVLLGISKNTRPSRPTSSECGGGYAMTNTLWILANKCWEMRPAERPNMATVLKTLYSDDPTNLKNPRRRNKLTWFAFRWPVCGALNT